MARRMVLLYTGPRAGHPLVALDCPAVPAGLMESELFGHVKGAFTSATGDRPGVFLLAAGGTLVLDEIGELPLSLQATFLRVLQSREVRPVGGTHPIAVNVRLIAATNRELRTLVRAGQFREDLFYRLEGIPHHAPPVARPHRGQAAPGGPFPRDVQPDPPAADPGRAPPRPGAALPVSLAGNVREMENAIERAAVLADRDVLDLPDFPQMILPLAGASPAPRNGSGVPRHQAGGDAADSAGADHTRTSRDGGVIHGDPWGAP